VPRVFTAASTGWMDISGDGSAELVRCTLGRSGVVPAASKREDDGASPAGVWLMRRLFWRPDRLDRPVCALPGRALRPDDGWCDDAGHRAYNTHITHPFDGRAETMWREDSLYDIVVVLGHNDAPVLAGQGSAIFLHLARPDWGPTAGCVGLELPALLTLLARAQPGDAVAILEPGT
jgi:L,D-peptidoglycan transpeptidase YkuD (ErfK/YbiS/YcfS/YnhG family)